MKNLPTLRFREDTLEIIAEEGVPAELLVYLNGKWQESCWNWTTYVEPQHAVLTYLYGQMQELATQGWLRRSLVNPRRWVFDAPVLPAP